MAVLGPAPKREHIRKTVETLGDLQLGIDVPVSFGPDRHQGLDQVYCTIIAGVRFVPLADQGWEKWRKPNAKAGRPVPKSQD